jgi:hypothetical protein
MLKNLIKEYFVEKEGTRNKRSHVSRTILKICRD